MAEEPLQILIAEDNAVSTKLLSYLLSPIGNCEIVADGQEAVELVGFCFDEGSPFDLICLDVMMPNMDGMEALKQIRKLEEKKGIPEDKRVKVMMTTVVPEKAEAENDCKGLYQAYLSKPYSKKDLWAALKSMGIDHPSATGNE